MNLIERVIQRGIEEKLISFVDWQRSLHLVRETVEAGHETGEGQATERPTSGNLFGEPVWSILIYLFIMHANRRTANVTHCCRVTGASRPSCLGCVEMLVEEEILIVDGNRVDAENPNLTLSSKGSRMAEEAIRRFIAAGSEESSAEARTAIGDDRLNERIAREMNISLKAVEMHRANMSATSG